MPLYSIIQLEILQFMLFFVVGFLLLLFFGDFISLAEVGRITSYILFYPPGYANRPVYPYLPPIQTLWFIAF